MRVHFATTRPYDLAVVAAWALAAVLVVMTVPSGWLRVVVGLPFILFIPGYAAVSLLYPERPRTVTVTKGEDGETQEQVREGIDPLERLALSFGLSVAIVPLIALALNYTPWGIRVLPVVLAVTAFTLLAGGAAAVRRGRLPEDERLNLRLEAATPDWGSYGPLDKVLVVALVAAVVVAGSALTYAALTPRTGEAFTEFYILGPEGKAAGYPTNVTAGTPFTLRLGLTNHEGTTVAYSVRAIDEQVGAGTNRTLRTWTVELADGAEWEENVTFSLTGAGTHQLRFEADKPGFSSPYRRLHLWVEVS